MSTKYSHGAFKHRKNLAHDVWDKILSYGYKPISVFSKLALLPNRATSDRFPVAPRDYVPEPKRGFWWSSIRAVKNFFTRKT